MDDILLGTLKGSKYPIQRKIITVASRSNRVAVKFTKKINNKFFSRINKTRVDLKGMKSGKRTPKLDAQKIAQIWGIRI